MDIWSEGYQAGGYVYGGLESLVKMWKNRVCWVLPKGGGWETGLGGKIRGLCVSLG